MGGGHAHLKEPSTTSRRPNQARLQIDPQNDLQIDIQIDCFVSVHVTIKLTSQLTFKLTFKLTSKLHSKSVIFNNVSSYDTKLQFALDKASISAQIVNLAILSQSTRSGITKNHHNLKMTLSEGPRVPCNFLNWKFLNTPPCSS